MIFELRTPALVCYRSVLSANAAAMQQRAASLGVALRPHFKTVKTLEAAAIATGPNQAVGHRGRLRLCCSQTLLLPFAPCCHPVFV